LVAKIGIQFGSEAVSVVQIQGGGKTFGAHRDRLKPVLGPLHPFDWLLHNLALWADSFGFRRLIGCGYRLNSSLDKHLAAQELPETRRRHLERIYDDRFLTFGMRPHPDLPDVFELNLADWRPRQTDPRNAEGTLTLLMGTALNRSKTRN
jgi:hypothetical protein